MKGPILASAVVTAASLAGGLLVGVALGLLVNSLPFHAPEKTMNVLGGIAGVVGAFGGGALWGFLLTRIHNFPNRGTAAIAGGLSFGLGMIGAAFLLLTLEKALVEQHRLPGTPIHVIFTMLFVPVTFLVATVGSSAILLASGNRAHWLRSALITGLAASLSFLVMDLVLDTLGMRVGGPGAAERFTMLTVAFLGSVAAAFSGGAVLGRALSREAVAAAAESPALT